MDRGSIKVADVTPCLSTPSPVQRRTARIALHDRSKRRGQSAAMPHVGRRPRRRNRRRRHGIHRSNQRKSRDYGAKVVSFQWIDDFSAARNESLRHATGDFIFWLDADEQLDDENRDRTRSLFDRLPDRKIAYLMRQHSLSDSAGGTNLVVDQVRLFRRLPQVRWERRLHEQILGSLERVQCSICPSPIVIRHYGYVDPVIKTAKILRNRDLVQKDFEANPEDPFTLFNLGSLYLDLGEFDVAITWYRRCVERSPAVASFVSKAKLRIAQTLRTIGRIDEADAACRDGVELYAKNPEWLFKYGIVRQIRGDHIEACRSFEAVLECPDSPVAFRGRRRVARVFGSSPSRNQPLGGETLHGGRTQTGVRLSTRIRFSVPRGLACSMSMTFRTALRNGGEPYGYLSAILSAGISPSLRERTLARGGDWRSALRLLEAEVTRSPRSIWLRMMLSDMLFAYAGDKDRAAAQLRKILESEPGHGDALRRLSRLQSVTYKGVRENTGGK